MVLSQKSSAQLPVSVVHEVSLSSILKNAVRNLEVAKLHVGKCDSAEEQVEQDSELMWSLSTLACC